MKKSLSIHFILITAIFMELLAGMEFDLFVPSFPQLQSHFHLTPSWVEALLSVNFIGYCLSLFYLGNLADRFGRRPIILLGLIIFILGSVCCVFPYTYVFLIGGRFLQGFGVAAPAVLSYVIIADNYPLKQQQFLMAVLNGAINFAVAIAPVIGSYMTFYFNWQGNFIALLVLGILTLLMTLIFIPTLQKPSTEPELGTHGYGLILKSRPLMLLIVALLFNFSPYWIFVGMSPLLYINDLHVSLVHFGYYQGALAFVFAICSISFGIFNRKINFDHKMMLQWTLILTMVCMIIMSLVTIADCRNPLLITLAFIPFIVAQIVPSIILYPFALNFLPQAKARVSALLQGARLTLTAIGLQIAGYFYQHSFQGIGVVLTGFIFAALMMLFLVTRNDVLMKRMACFDGHI